MKTGYALAFALLCALFSSFKSSAQNFSITYQLPDHLVVCDADTLVANIQNLTGGLISNAQFTLELPAGLEYLPGSVSGGLELNILNLQKPVFTVLPLSIGGMAELKLQIRASCGLIESINSGQLFAALLRVQSGPLLDQVTTAAFPVETGLLVITQVDGDSLSGEKDDVLLRTLHVQNTRLGVVRHLTLTDTHQAGISIHVPGAASETNLPNSFTALIDGSFFTAFGDGDDLLEFGEEILIQEVITVTDCGYPPHLTRSAISTAWGCTADMPTCQADSTRAKVLILTSTKIPQLVFSAEFGFPWEQCAQEAVPQVIVIKNLGTAPAKNVLVQVHSSSPSGVAMDAQSFTLQTGNGAPVPFSPNLAADITLACGQQVRQREVTLVLPEVPAMDSVRLSFDAYFCGADSCQQLTPVFLGSYYYALDCPVGGSKVDTFRLEPPEVNYSQLKAELQYDLKECMMDNTVYDFNYAVMGNRLQSADGYLWIVLDLPWGLSLDQSCTPLADGVAPVLLETQLMVTSDTITRIRIAYPLPLPNDTVHVPFCLLNRCFPPPPEAAASFIDMALADQPDASGNFNAYTGNCSRCGYELNTTAMFSRQLIFDRECSIPACSNMKLRTACEPCLLDDVIPQLGPYGDCLQCIFNNQTAERYFKAYRLNMGLADHNNDRHADPGFLDLNKIRRDRFIPGDTMRTRFGNVITSGDSVCWFIMRLFTETIRSDIGLNGTSDDFKVVDAQGVMANDDQFRLLHARVKVYDSSTEIAYYIPLDSAIHYHVRDKLHGNVLIANTNPPIQIDEFVTMNHLFSFTLDDLSHTGFLPPCFALEEGDSIIVEADFKLDFNFTPFSSAMPPLINFELTYNDFYPFFPDYYSYRRGDTLMFQYSGYKEEIASPSFGIKACENSVEVNPFKYQIRLARENLFPFEVRPLSSISDYKLFMPADYQPVSTTLKFLKLQENVPLFQNLPIPNTAQDSVLDLDFSSFFIDPLDEGYQLETNIVFGPDCSLKAPDTSAQRLVLDYTGCLHMPDPDTIRSTNVLGFLSNQARAVLSTSEPTIDSPNGEVSADLFLQNTAPIAAPNFWVRLVSVEGGLTDFNLFLMPQNQAPPAVNGIFQLGTLGLFGQQNLRVYARNLSCLPQHLLVIYGWDCSPYEQPGAYSCDADSLYLLIEPLHPELELDLGDLPTQIPLCDTSSYFQFEMFNADLGYAFSPIVNVELPPGISIVPGSCQMAYPAGSPFLPIPDPGDVGGGLFEWNLSAIQTQLGTDGLPGVNLAPQNTVQIRFRLQAECGAVSNAQIVFGTHARQYCGLSTNLLRKASEPVIIEGLTPEYGVQIGLSETGSSGPVGCSEERTVQVNLQIGGMAQPGDSIYIDLPAGFSYVPGSYQAGANAPAGPPFLSPNGLQLPLPGGLPPNSGLSFSLKILAPALPNCTGATLHVQTRQAATAFCPLINADCAVYIATGEAIYTFVPNDPEVVITGATVSVNAGGAAEYSATLLNSGGEPASPNLLLFYRDVDGDGQLSAGDTVVHAAALTGTIGPGGSFLFSENDAPNPGELCHLLAVLPAAENCDCEPSVYPVQADLIEYAPQAICLGDLATVGLDSLAGHVYHWLGQAPGPCATCPQALVSPAAPGQYLFTLTDETTNCTVTYNFPVQVNPLPQGLGADTSSCDNETILLVTGPATTWQWSGPGITDPGAPSQLVQPAQTSVYAVTLTNAFGCLFADSITVKVSHADNIDLGIIKTCEGTPVSIFGVMTETAGTYTQHLTNQNGCDSLVTVKLEIVLHTFETLPRCPGETLLVFGNPVNAAGTYCQYFVSSLGCDSMHCVVVSDLPAIQVIEFDTLHVAPGGSVPLPGPPGFATYAWSPAEGLSCTDCPTPIASPTDTTEYTLIVTNGNGCTASLHFFIIPFPPCDPFRLAIPNAITPDGDGVNDVFRVVPFEGVEVISRLQVYDRWGQKVYEGAGSGATWDGRIDGKPAPSDTYVWILEVECSGDREQRVGDVTVLR